MHPEKRSLRSAALAHLLGLIIPWWPPFLARQSNKGGHFVDDHRRLAQRIQGTFVLGVLGLFALSAVVPWVGPAATWTLVPGYVLLESWLGVSALRGHAYRLAGPLSFERADSPVVDLD